MSFLDDFIDVDTTTPPPADGDGLVYDAATGEWGPGFTLDRHIVSGAAT